MQCLGVTFYLPFYRMYSIYIYIYIYMNMKEKFIFRIGLAVALLISKYVE